MSTATNELRENYCFWCGAYGKANKTHCYNCGYEIGSLPPEVKALFEAQRTRIELEALSRLLKDTVYVGGAIQPKHVQNRIKDLQTQLTALDRKEGKP